MKMLNVLSQISQNVFKLKVIFSFDNLIFINLSSVNKVINKIGIIQLKSNY